jgi:hypothetical protein
MHAARMRMSFEINHFISMRYAARPAGVAILRKHQSAR